MEHEEYGIRAAYVILREDGAVVMNDCYNGFDEEANYNMIDGLMNNTPKKKDKNASRRSVLKRLRKHQ